MKKILQVRGKSKVRRAKAVEVKRLSEYGAMGIDSKVALIQELIPLGLMHIEDLLQREVIELAGERYKRNGLHGYDRWGKQQGSVYIKDQRIPITLQRVRDTINNREVSLRSYERFQQPSSLDEGLFKEAASWVKLQELQGVFRGDPWGIIAQSLYRIEEIHKGEYEETKGAYGA